MQHRVVEQIGSEPGRVVEQIADVTIPTVKQTSSFVRQTTKEIGDGVQHVLSKRMQERYGDSNIKGLDTYNIPRARVLADKNKAVGADGTFPSRRRSLKFVKVKKGPKRVFVDFGPPHSALKPYTGESVYCGASSACPPGLPWQQRGVQHQGSGQVQHVSIWRCDGARASDAGPNCGRWWARAGDRSRHS